MSKLKSWKEGMENKGLRVDMKKTRLMVTGPDLDVLCDSGAFPCAVCQVFDRRTQSFAHSASSGCIRGAVVSRAELLQTQTMFVKVSWTNSSN